MKERIKKFYEEHKNEVIVGSVVGAVTAILIIKKIDGRRITTADFLTRDDGASMIVVNRKNGSAINFRRDPPE